MPRRKTNIYDPQYLERYGNIGESIRRNNLENLVEQRRYYPAPIPEDQDMYNVNTQDDEYIFDPEEYNTTASSEETFNEPGFFESIGNWFSNEWDGFVYRLSHGDDLIYMARERQLQGGRDTAAGKAREDAINLNVLRQFKDFIDLQEQYKKLQTDLEVAQSNDDAVAAQSAQYQMQMFLQEHPDYHQRESEYFTQIKTNPALQNYYITLLQVAQVKIWELLPEPPEKILLQIWIARMNLYKKPEKPQINMAVQGLCGKALNRSAELQKARYSILQDMQQIP